MIRIIRTTTLLHLQTQVANGLVLEKDLEDAKAELDRVAGLHRAAVKARNDEGRKFTELYVQLGEATTRIERLSAELKRVTAERDDARADLATIDKAADDGLVRIVPQPRRETLEPASVPEAEVKRRVFDYPHESTDPALVVEHADQVCDQCMKAIPLLSIKDLQTAMVLAHKNDLVIAQLLILNEVHVRVKSVKPEEGQA
ncbi:hypothetical protein [Streptomyces sp. NPDC127092]|uniref:hypothetical protein n=1 Tax=Streptomyces sp. NPDC127092 TaxID=3347135 RepID=UPI0036491E55